MKVWNWVLAPVAGVALFAGTTAGLLWMQGRLDYEGTRDVPVFDWLFSAPEDTAGPERADASVTPPAAPIGETAGGAVVGGGPERPDTVRTPGSTASRASDLPGIAFDDAPPVSPVIDFAELMPGDVQKFEQMFREAERRLDEVEARERALDRRERELRIREEDLLERDRAVTMAILGLDAERERLDARLRQFREDVRLVRSTELQKVQDLAAFLLEIGPESSADFIEHEWKDPEGQDRVVTAVAQMSQADAARTLRALSSERRHEIRVRCVDVATERKPR